MQEDIPNNKLPDENVTIFPSNSNANIWNNLITKKFEPAKQIYNPLEKKKAIWENFSIKNLIEYYDEAPLRFKVLVFFLFGVLTLLLIFLAIAFFINNATNNLKSLDKSLKLIESNSPTVQNNFVPIFPNALDVKDKQNYINGELSTTSDFNKFINTRPIAVPIDNAILARNQMSGILSADFVYEFPMEESTNRFLAIFWSKKPVMVGPVRSLRVYFMDILPDTDSVINHIGQATTDAGRKYSVFDAENIDSIAYFSKYSIEHTECGTLQDKTLSEIGTPIEHTYFTNISTISSCIPASWEREPKNDPYLFKTDLEKDLRPVVSEVNIKLNNDENAIGSRWVYDPITNTYKRYQNDLEHKERELGQISTKNLILQEAIIENVFDDEKHLTIDLIGEGNATVLIDGKVIKAKWIKSDRNSKTRYYNLSGEEIRFNRGKFWVSIVPSQAGNSLSYKITIK